MARERQTDLAVLGALSIAPMTGYAVREGIRDVLGQVDVHVTSTGYSASESETLSGVNAFGGKQMSLSSSESESENTSIQRQDLFGANDMRSLSADYCLFVGNVGDRAVDEVLAVKPLYV